MRAVVEAAADHLSAEWVVFALVDGELADAHPRHLVRGPDGAESPARDGLPARCGRAPGRRCAGAPTPTSTTPSSAAATCTCRSGWTAGWSAGSIAWTPPDREIDDTDHSVLRILAGQTAAALQNCALLDHAARLHARTTRQADDLKARNDELLAHPGRAGRGPAARGARRRAAPDRPRAARQRHPVRAVRRDAHRAGPLGDRRRAAARPARHGQGPDPPGRRAAPLGDLRAQRRRRRRRRRGPAVDAAPAVRRAHARRAAGRGADRRQAGGAARRVRAVAVPDRRRGAVQHRGARARPAAPSSGWPTGATRCG